MEAGRKLLLGFDEHDVELALAILGEITRGSRAARPAAEPAPTNAVGAQRLSFFPFVFTVFTILPILFNFH